MKRSIVLTGLILLISFSALAVNEITEIKGLKDIDAFNTYIKKLSSSIDAKNSSNKKTILIIDAWAAWCGPCKQFKPVYEKVVASGEFSKDFRFFSLDIMQFSDAIKISVKKDGTTIKSLQAVPSLIVVVDGEVKEIEPGYKTEEDLVSFLKNLRKVFLQ